jgi:hypothetical protein
MTSENAAPIRQLFPKELKVTVEKAAAVSTLEDELWEKTRRLTKNRLRTRLRSALEDRGLPHKPPSHFGIDLNVLADHLGPVPNLDRPHRYHIDHIVPLDEFDLSNVDQVRKAFSPENIQWLSKKANLRKGKKKRRQGGRSYEYSLAVKERIAVARELKKQIRDTKKAELQLRRRKGNLAYIEALGRLTGVLQDDDIPTFSPGGGDSEKRSQSHRSALSHDNKSDSATDTQRSDARPGMRANARTSTANNSTRSAATRSESSPRNGCPAASSAPCAERPLRVTSTSAQGAPIASVQCAKTAISLAPRCAQTGVQKLDSSDETAHNARGRHDSVAILPPKEVIKRRNHDGGYPVQSAPSICNITGLREYELNGATVLEGTRPRRTQPRRWADPWNTRMAEVRARCGIPEYGMEGAHYVIPAPPRLSKTGDAYDRANTLIHAYKAAVRRLWPSHKFRGLNGNPRNMKCFPQLLAAAEKLLEAELSPLAWAVWWLEIPERDASKKRAKSPPPIWTVFSADRIWRFRGWHRREIRNRTLAGTRRRPPEAWELARKLSTLKLLLQKRDPDPSNTEAVRAVVQEVFPGDSHARLLQAAVDHAGQIGNRLKHAANLNTWIWDE